MRIRQLNKEQVRKRGLPPLLLGLDERGQAPLPDLFVSDRRESSGISIKASMRIRQLNKEQVIRIGHVDKEQVRKRGLPPLLLGLDERGQAPLPDLFISDRRESSGIDVKHL